MNSGMLKGLNLACAICAAIRKEAKPGDIFYKHQLEKWAKENGFVKKKKNGLTLKTILRQPQYQSPQKSKVKK